MAECSCELMQSSAENCPNCANPLGEYDPALPPRFSRPVSELRAMARDVPHSARLERWLVTLVLGLGAVEVVVLGGALAYLYF